MTTTDDIFGDIMNGYDYDPDEPKQPLAGKKKSGRHTAGKKRFAPSSETQRQNVQTSGGYRDSGARGIHRASSHRNDHMQHSVSEDTRRQSGARDLEQHSNRGRSSADDSIARERVPEHMPAQRKARGSTTRSRAARDDGRERNDSTAKRANNAGLFSRIAGIFRGRGFMDVVDAFIVWLLDHLPVLLLASVIMILVGLFVNRYISFGCAFVLALAGIVADKRVPERDPFIFFGVFALGIFIIPYLF